MLLANRLSLINNAALRSQSSLERRVGRLQAVWGGWLFLDAGATNWRERRALRGLIITGE
jgi:hypothetical protein